jgi:hypothetical protein
MYFMLVVAEVLLEPMQEIIILVERGATVEAEQGLLTTLDEVLTALLTQAEAEAEVPKFLVQMQHH